MKKEEKEQFDDILPCPFCGAPSIFNDLVFPMLHSAYISCTNCQALMSFKVGSSPKYVVEMWNKRVEYFTPLAATTVDIEAPDHITETILRNANFAMATLVKYQADFFYHNEESAASHITIQAKIMDLADLVEEVARMTWDEYMADYDLPTTSTTAQD